MSAKVLETFTDPKPYWFEQMRTTEPTVWNGRVNVSRYRVTVEDIDEPDAVIAERLEKLWVESNNTHDMGPLRTEAKKIGYEFKGQWGSKRP